MFDRYRGMGTTFPSRPSLGRACVPECRLGEITTLNLFFRIRSAVVLAAVVAVGCGHGAGVLPPNHGLGWNQHQSLLHPGLSVMSRVHTWGTIDGGADSIKVPVGVAAPWLDYALTVPSLSGQVKAAGIHGALYTDPNRQAPGDLMYTNDESTFAHDCSGNRITVSGSANLLMDVHSSHLWALWPQMVQTETKWCAVFDYIFEDSADEVQTSRLSAPP